MEKGSWLWCQLLQRTASSRWLSVKTRTWISSVTRSQSSVTSRHAQRSSRTYSWITYATNTNLPMGNWSSKSFPLKVIKRHQLKILALDNPWVTTASVELITPLELYKTISKLRVQPLITRINMIAEPQLMKALFHLKNSKKYLISRTLAKTWKTIVKLNFQPWMIGITRIQITP